MVGALVREVDERLQAFTRDCERWGDCLNQDYLDSLDFQDGGCPPARERPYECLRVFTRVHERLARVDKCLRASSRDCEGASAGVGRAAGEFSVASRRGTAIFLLAGGCGTRTGMVWCVGNWARRKFHLFILDTPMRLCASLSLSCQGLVSCWIKHCYNLSAGCDVPRVKFHPFLRSR